jgi:branched-chain amino acid transport system permease protein
MLWRAFMIGLVVVFVLWLPLAAGQFFSQVVVLVALYILMGLGLNITLGLAGLLDLGFVAFFAIGGYTVGLLTSSAEYGIAHWPFWAAVPVAIVVAMLFGAFRRWASARSSTSWPSRIFCCPSLAARAGS